MRRLRVIPLLVALLCLAVRADESLLHARRAQALLGRDVWSRVVRIENRAPDIYPRTVHALVFEFAGRLWFYCSANGTQSFSVYADRLAADKADFGPLLREIERGFTRWRTLPAAEVAAGPLDNACFIESIAAARARLAKGGAVAQAQLLTYYVDTGGGRQGHTVLVYRENGALVLFDPADPRMDFSFPASQASDALALARAHEGADVAKARFLPVPAPAEMPRAHLMAAR